MNTKKQCLYAASLMVCGLLPFTASAAEATTSEFPELPLYRPFTLGLEAGTTGFGGAVSWRFADHWGARFGFNGFEYSDNRYVIKDLEYDAKIRVMSEPLTLDIYPWKAHSFHISVGIQFNQNQVTGSAVDSGTIIPPAVIGTVNLNVEQQPVNPYLSIGGNFFYFDRAHRWALGGELGVAYTGEPKVSLTSSLSGPVIDAALQYEESRIKEYADKFKWWPVAKLMVNYSF